MTQGRPAPSPRGPSPLPADFIARRLERVRQALEKAKAPALLVTSFTDVSWLTGFEGDDSHAIVTPEKLILISDHRYEEQITREAPWAATVMRKKTIWQETANQLKRLKVKKVAVQAEALTLRGQATLHEFLKKAKTKLRMAAVADMIVELRHIKDEHEIGIIEEAIRIAEGAFEALQRQIRRGMTENDLAGRLGYEMRKRGALNSSFDSIVAAGANGSLPHYRPGEARLEANSPLLVDWGARYRGYCSDLTRVVFAGEVSGKIREIYQIVLEAQLAAIAAIRPGAHGKKVDRAARDIIEKAGYGEQFGHGTGHGIGRDIHEAISLSKLSTTRLKPGMIVTVEPGIYLPGSGGVRIEDDVLVTPEGHRVLSKLPKDLASASLSI
ncbi:MAG TPA: Xaa-Pro peptidase family protein [Phycisphaerae bacterium]|nr:Xaa-Pro peptidase family protein [Phycisphaerae bacterium]